MKFFLITLIFIFFTFNSTLAQYDKVFPKEYTVLKVKPSQTDVKIKTADTPHLVVYNSSVKQGKLLFFMPGTNGIALRGPKKLFAAAVNQGYHVINLSYINTPAVAQVCRGENLSKDSRCTSKFRKKRIFGDNDFLLIKDEPQDAIVNRLTKLLIYLSEIDKKGNWDFYLENGLPKWNEIVVFGQSQGGGMAAFIAKKHLVARVVNFSGGWDYSKKNKMAAWYIMPAVTPLNRWYGTYHVKEPKAKELKEIYKAMKIPESQIYPFSLAVPEGRKAHSNGVRNIGYLDQWVELLGRAN